MVILLYMKLTLEIILSEVFFFLCNMILCKTSSITSLEYNLENLNTSMVTRIKNDNQSRVIYVYSIYYVHIRSAIVV